MFSLKGRGALITGASGGIGSAVAKAMSEAGADVTVSDLDQEAAAKLAAEIVAAGGSARAVGLDVRNVQQAENAARVAAEANDGVLHIVVNNAGVISPAMFHKMTDAAFDLVVDVHLKGTFVVSRAALPYMPQDGTGRIINVTSAAGLVGTIGQVNYAAAKAGIIGVTKSLARELARRSITVNALAPLAATAMTENIRSHEQLSAATLARIALGRWATPEEIAPSFVYFASDAASYVTGQVLAVDGGTVI
jgi:3-oxoacyl-[acyl-carrier protein] reductase